MAYIKDQLFDIPLGNVERVTKANGTTYIYIVIKSFGKYMNLIIKKVCIGKVDPATNKLIANKAYFTYYSPKPLTKDQIDNKFKPKQDIVSEIVCYQGNAMQHLVYQLVKLLDLDGALKSIFPYQYEEIIDLATYVLQTRADFKYITDFQTRQQPFGDILDIESVNQLCEELYKSDIEEFFGIWESHLDEEELLYYDLTKMSDYSQAQHTLDLLQGYKLTATPLDKIHLTMLVGKKDGIPIHFDYFIGNIPDKIKIASALVNATDLAKENVTFILNHNFNTVNNQDLLNCKDFKFIMPMSLQDKKLNQLFKKHYGNMINYENLLFLINYSATSGMKLKSADSPFSYHLYNNEVKGSLERHNLLANIKFIVNDVIDLTNMKESSAPEYNEIFNVIEKSSLKKELDWVQDNDNITKNLRESGYFALVTNYEHLNPQAVLSYYCHKNILESIYDSINTDINFHPMPIYCDNTLRGKLFIGFIALILRTTIENIKNTEQSIKYLSCNRICDTLSNIMVYRGADGKMQRQKLSVEQKNICKAFDIDIDDLTSFMSLD